MADNSKQKAEALLEAHVAFQAEELTGEGFQALAAQELDAVLANASKLKLKDVVSPAQIRETAHKYAVDLELSGAIPELVGEIARQIYDHPGHDDTLLSDLVSDAQFNEVLDKALEMKELRNTIIHEAVSNPVYEALVADITYYGITGYINENPVTRNVPGAQSMMKLGKSVMSKAGPGLEKNLKAYVRKNLKPLLKESESFLQNRIDDERIAEAAREIWEDFKGRKVSVFRDYLSKQDVEEFFVIGYEYWKTLRKTDYYASWIDTGVDFFFDKYGKASLTDLLDEMGISRDMILDDIMRFAPPILKTLKKKGILEEILRRQFSRFYASDAALKVLGE
jgi:hypothetical protein